MISVCSCTVAVKDFDGGDNNPRRAGVISHSNFKKKKRKKKNKFGAVENFLRKAKRKAYEGVMFWAGGDGVDN